jgi:predicted nucleic acid-binding Zn ribbon protein
VSARRRPRPAADALRSVLADSAPATLLAAVQRVWGDAVGPAIAAQAQPVSEREGTVTVTCRSATWAQELDLMQEQLAERVNDALGEPQLAGLRFTANAARHSR